MNYLLQAVDTYRVETVEQVEALHDELLADNHFTLIAFSYKTKYIKIKGEVVSEYQIVTAKKMFTDEKEPEDIFEVFYARPGESNNASIF